MADDKTFTKAELDAAIATAVGKVQESIDALETKNAELIGEVRTAKAAARKAGEITPDTHQAEVDRADNAEAKIKELDASIKTLTKERDTATKALETESAFTAKLLKQDGIKTQLIANGVKDDTYIADLTDAFSGKVVIKAEGDERVAMVGDKTLADHMKEWAGSDAGKKYVAAAANSGGGALGGSKGEQAGKTMLRSAYDGMTTLDQGNFVREGGKVVDQAA